MLVLWSLAAAFLSPSDAIDGTWVLKSVYRTSNVQGPSLSEQRQLIGSKIVINGSHLHACGQTVLIRSRAVHNLTADQFVFNTHARLKEVGISLPSVTEIALNKRERGRCFGTFPAPGQLLYVKSPNELVIDFEGAFYRAVRTN